MKKYIIFNKKKFSYVIFILCLLFFSGCGQEPEPVHNSDIIESVPPQESATETELMDSENDRTLNLIGIYDIFADADEHAAFFGRSDALEKIISFNQILNSQFEFYEIYTQSLESKFYWDMDDSFLDSYNGMPIKNQEINLDGEKCYISRLNSFQVNSKAYQYFFDFIGEGRGFCEDDFVYKSDERIPVILGNDYKAYYTIGDSIELNYLQKDIEYEVIGFFEQGLNIKIVNSVYDIDKYKCNPFFEFDCDVRDDFERTFWSRYYEEKNLGYIKVDITDNLSEEEIIELYRVKIKEIAEELEIPYSVLDMVYNISSEIVSADE